METKLIVSHISTFLQVSEKVISGKYFLKLYHHQAAAVLHPMGHRCCSVCRLRKLAKNSVLLKDTLCWTSLLDVEITGKAVSKG